MRYPLAFGGVKKLFTSEILTLIAAVCTLVGAVAAVLTLSALQNASEGGVRGGAFVTLLLGVGAAVLLLIAYIMKLIGLKKAAMDEAKFKQAFILAIIALILSAAASILNSLNIGNGIVDNIVRVFAIVADIFITIYVIQGIQNLAFKLDDQEVNATGSKLLIIIVVFYILALIATLIPIFFGANDATAVITGIIEIIGSVLNLIAAIVFIVYLGKAKTMLAEN